MKNITILRGSRSSHKPPVKFEVIETDKYILVRKKSNKRLGGELLSLSDDGESLVFAYDSKSKDFKKVKQKKLKK